MQNIIWILNTLPCRGKIVYNKKRRGKPLRILCRPYGTRCIAKIPLVLWCHVHPCGCRTVVHAHPNSRCARANDTSVDTMVHTSPGIINEWFSRYLPITVVPERSKFTVAMSDG